VDASNLSAVREVVDTVIKKGDVPPHIPYEFTQQGMMDRIGVYLLYQDFCRGNSLLDDNGVSVCVTVLHFHCTNSTQLSQQLSTRL